MNGIKSWAYHRLYGISPTNTTLYRLCALYADRYRGENNRDKYRNGEFRYLQEVIPKCEVVFDAGAFEGHWAEEALSIKNTLALHCFEPCAETFAKLQERLAAHANSDVSLNNIGLSDKPGTAEFHPFSNVRQASSLYIRDGSPAALGEQSQPETVHLTTLGDYCRENAVTQIDLLKVDVEGHELAVLHGGETLFAENRIQRVQFEYSSANIHSRVFFKDLFGHLTGHGYHVFKVFPKHLRRIEEYKQDLDNFQYANYVAALPEYDGEA